MRGPANGAVVFDEGDGKTAPLDEIPQGLNVNSHIERARFKGQVSLRGVEATVYKIG